MNIGELISVLEKQPKDLDVKVFDAEIGEAFDITTKVEVNRWTRLNTIVIYKDLDY